MLNIEVGNNYSSKNIFVSLFIILLCCVIAYWPLSFGIFSLKNDIIVYFLPVRYQISDMINQGQFPFWTPYINLGHPLYTDMQSGAWNPIVWFISLFGSYSMRTIQLELLFYIYLSGVSMFFLLKYSKLNKHVNLLISISFMLCGFISDTTQTLYWISGMSFLPMVFLYFLKTLREKSFSTILFFSFFLYLLFASAYPGEFIIIAYLLLSYFIVYIIKNKKETIQVFKKMFLALLIFLIFALPSIMAYLSGLSHIERGGGVGIDLALTNSMHPFSLISYFFPLSSWKLPISETDITGRNSYIGLLPFLLLILSMFIKTKNDLLVFFKWVFILSVILSFGKFGYLRNLTYYFLPFTDTFRHPSMFRFVSIFSGCILAAFTLDNIIKAPETFVILRKRSFIALITLLVITSIIILFSFSNYYNLFPSLSIKSLKTWLDNSTLKNWLIIELLIQIPFLILLYLFFVKKVNIKILYISAILNSIIHTLLIQPVTVVGTESVSSFELKINSIKKKGFPIPNLEKNINSPNEGSTIDISRYGPPNVYSKNIGYQNYFITPGPLIAHEDFMRQKNVPSAIFDYPILYRADTAMFYKDSSSLPANKKFVLLNKSSLITEVNNMKLDTAFSKKIINYKPSKWEFEIIPSEEGFFCLVQNYYPNWKLKVNGKKENLYRCNGGLIGFKLPKGKNIVTIEFKDDKILTVFYVNIVVLTIFAFYCFRKLFLFYFGKNKKL